MKARTSSQAALASGRRKLGLLPADEVEGPAEREKKKVISHFTQKYFFDLDADDYLGYHEEERYG
jgi:hypothetical protein